MKTKLKISLTKKPDKNSSVSIKNINIRERVLRFFLGERLNVVILVSGDMIEDIEISRSVK